MMSVQVTKEMIASNVPVDRRVAPLLRHMSIIDDIYAFAALLRVGPGRPEDDPPVDGAPPA